MNNKYEIDIEDFRFYITVTDYHHQPAQGPSADSDWGCYGYTEIDWECTQVLEYDEDDNESEVTVDIAEYSELIEQELLNAIADEMSDQGYDDFDDGYCGY